MSVATRPVTPRLLTLGGLVLLLAALALAGCKGASESGEGAGDKASAPACAKADGEPELVDGTADEIMAAIRAPGAKAVVVNAWATWCAPCVEEFPAFVAFNRAHCEDGLRTLFVSADFDRERAKAVAFLKEQGVAFRSFMKVGDEDAFITALHPDWSGALPATFVYDGAGNLQHFVDGVVDTAKLEAMVGPLLAGGDAPKATP